MSTTKIRQYIGDIMVTQEVITEQQLDEALAILEREPESTNRRLGQILYQDLGLDRNLIMKSISDFYAFGEVFEDDEYIDSSVVEGIKQHMNELPQDIIDELIHQKALPLYIEHHSITVAASDPTDPILVDLIEQLNFREYEIVYCRYELLEDVLTEVYEQKNEFLDLLDEIEYDEPDLEQNKEKTIDEEEIDAEINQSMLNSLVEGMLVEAVRQGVSDIHIVPSGPAISDIRFRIDGKLDLWHRQKSVKPEAISAVVKDKTRNVDRFERDASQDGFIQRQVDNHSIRYRVSIMPMVGKQFDRKFESVVIRVLDDRKVITDLNVLGLQEKAKADFVKAIEKPSGIVIITGPTGSGKSTTLVAALHYVIDPSVNVLTVEEPVEYLIEGARQLKLSNNMSFDQAMRGILRHDPDIVLVGEIRDLKTAEIAIKLANTGHLTFSTLHTNDAPSAVSRLYKMGVEPFLIANAVNLIMAQRLVRRLCSDCKEQYEPHPEMARGIGFTDEEIEATEFYKANGCEICTNGYKGRAAIMEALYFDAEIRKMILESGSEIDEAQIKQYAISQGMLSLRASGRERIKNGVTSIEEVAAITIEDESASGSDTPKRQPKQKPVNDTPVPQTESSNPNLSPEVVQQLLSLLQNQNNESGSSAKPQTQAGEPVANDQTDDDSELRVDDESDIAADAAGTAAEEEPSEQDEGNESEKEVGKAIESWASKNGKNGHHPDEDVQEYLEYTKDNAELTEEDTSNDAEDADVEQEETEADTVLEIDGDEQIEMHEQQEEAPDTTVDETEADEDTATEPATDDRISEEEPKVSESDPEIAEDESPENVVYLNGHRQTETIQEEAEEQKVTGDTAHVAESKMEYIRHFLQEPPTIVKNFHHDDILEFLSCGDIEHYQKGDTIISEQENVKAAYLVVDGEVTVWKENIQLAVLSKGAFLGETFLFSKNNRMAQIVSEGKSSLLRFDRAAALGFFRQKPEKLFKIFTRNISELQQNKMGNMNEQLFQLKKRLLSEDKW